MGAMVLAASDFYVSGGFWVSALGAVAGVLGTIAIIVVTIWIGRPQRRLLYWMPVSAPLLNAGQDVRGKLTVTRGNEILSEPQLLEIGLLNQGRLDIPTTAFDREKPLRLDVGEQIVELLDVTTVPANRAVPDVQIDGSTLLIGPSLIPKRETVVFSLLIDGPEPRLTCVAPELIDVDVDERHQDGLHDLVRHLLGRRGVPVVSAAGIISLVLLLVIGLLIGRVYGAPVATSVGCTITGSLQPGQTVELTYHFDSSAARQIGLGAGLYDNTGKDHSTGHGDIGSYQLAPGGVQGPARCRSRAAWHRAATNSTRSCGLRWRSARTTPRQSRPPPAAS